MKTRVNANQPKMMVLEEADQKNQLGYMINNLMGSLKLYLLLLLLTTVFSYALEGTWGTVKGNNDQTKLTFESQNSQSDGAPSYILSLSSCPGVIFSIIARESFLLIRSSGPNSTCDVTTGQIVNILPLLAEKILYFEIFYDTLVLTSIYGKGFLGLRRIRIKSENRALFGNFYLLGLERSPLIMSNGTNLSLCEGDLTVDFYSNNIDTINVDPSTVQDNGCSDGGQSQQVLNLLTNSKYYRSVNNRSVVLYDTHYQRIGELVQAKMPTVEPPINLKTPMLELGSQIDKKALQLVNLDPTLRTINTINHMPDVEVVVNHYNNTDVHLVGAYQPKQIDRVAVPLDKSQKVTYIFGLNSVFVAGLCINYNYDYSVKNGVYISITKNTLKQSKSQLPAAECDIAGDQVYLTPLEDARSYDLTASQIQFLNSKGVSNLLLERIEGDPGIGA